MDITAAKLFADSKIKEHGLSQKGWEVVFNDGLRVALGRCSHQRKQIELNPAYVKTNPENLVFDTILHEIAHAMTHPSVRHGPEWKAICIKIGAIPRASWKDHKSGLVTYYKPKW